ncbi:MAG: carbon-nitrogen family hydrolase [Actinomycetota bacterium]|nr:carbon-nitrogen family hydrolase [Actinomycetota bacterium]
MLIGGLQCDTVWEDRAANFERLRPEIGRAAAAGVRLLVLPELFSTGFSMATDRIAEPVDGPSASFLREQAMIHGMWVGGSVPERPAGADRPFNTFVLSAPDGRLHRYRKMHTFTASGEDQHYAAGDGPVTVEVGGFRTTLFVCYDLRFGEGFWDTALTTDLYLVPANWPEVRRTHWTTLLRARAIENQAYVLGVNRVGRDGNDLSYVGDTLVVGPWGEVLAAASGGETLVMARVDAASVQEARERFPLLQERQGPAGADAAWLT